ncbi:DNA helicase [Tanacetum coccineum]
MHHFGGPNAGTLNPDIVKGLIHMLDEHNGLVRPFRTAQDRCQAGEIPGFKIRLYNMGGVRGYELLTYEALGGIVFESGPRSRTYFDVIIKFRGKPPQRINKLHQSYMSLQFPLLFIFSQLGFYPDITLKPRDGRGRGKIVKMNAYYKYQLHLRVKEFGLIFKSRRLFQQYVVVVFCAIEQNRLDFMRMHQNYFRSDNLSGLYDAVSRGDRDGIAAGSKIMLPSTFIEGPWFLKEVKTFGYVSAVLYTIEFQKTGLPNYHTLLWVDSKNELKHSPQINYYIFADIPDLVQDPIGYKLVTELIMHGPCDTANLGPPKLWAKHWQSMRDDIPSKISKATGIPNYHVNTAELQGYILYELETILSARAFVRLWSWWNRENISFENDYQLTLIPRKDPLSSSFIRHRLSQLIDFIYDDIILATPTIGSLQEKTIVCPKNTTADAVNAKIMSNIEGQSRTYLSNDEAIPMGRETSKTELLYPMEYLNTITFLEFLPYELELKVG